MELKVSNFAIIENIHIQFKKGLNILTGETGAGKSVLLKSLSLLMGFKGSTESIRSGYQQASIEGSFDISDRPDIQEKLEELGIECDDDQLIVKRVLSEDKSRIYINGSINTLNTLREIVAPLIEVAGQAAPLIEMTGQFDNRNLFSKNYHLDVLDQYAGNWASRTEYQKKYNSWRETLTRIESLQQDSQATAQRLDFLTFQRDEIKNLELDPKTDQDLDVEIKKLKNSSKISGFTDQAEDALVAGADSATQRINVILKQAFEVGQLDPEIIQRSELLRQAKTLIEEAVYDLRQYSQKIDTDPQGLDQLEQRLSDIRKLQKKYGPSVEGILTTLKELEAEISNLQNIDFHIAELTQKAAGFEVELKKMAKELHKRRESAAKLLSNSVNEELLDLNMKGVTFHVDIRALPALGATGYSDVEFMSQTSSKDPHRPLAKFASGGELSRILLSLKRVTGAGQQPRTYLFDEVDTGVSGPTAEKVGRKLFSIAKAQQVICVTHLPQVAAFGTIHFFIQKSNIGSSNSKTKASKSDLAGNGAVAMEVTELSKKERVNEIARLISGEKISKTSLAHAEELLKEAH
jgi:DNA repair protein RecN (Recombination protein N)